MKEVVIAFLIALVIGSIINGSQEEAGANTQPQSAAATEQALSSTVAVDETNFESEVIDSATPVLVDFYSDTCGPCKRMEPILGEVANEYQGSLKVARVDVLRTPHLSQKYKVGPIPAFMVFKEGKCEQVMVGAMPKSELVAMVKPYLASVPEGSAPQEPVQKLD